MNNYINNMFPNEFMMAYPEAIKPGNVNELSMKLSKQAGDNMNFNKCGFDGKINPDNLYDVYNGFIRGNMFPNLFNQYKLSRPYDVKGGNERNELLNKVNAYCFAAHDLNLYLDTHPEDQRALCMHREYCKQVKDLKDKYQKMYGPLTIFYPCNKWRWLEQPWPWERGNY